jgi:hypothetical protein
MALYDQIASATFLGGSWRLRPVGEHSRALLRHTGLSVAIIADLPDGRSLAAVTRWSTRVTHWITARFAQDDPVEGPNPGRPRVKGRSPWPRDDKFLDAPAEVPVYGTSLARILATALDNDGDITHLESGRLSDLIRGDLGNRLRRYSRGARPTSTAYSLRADVPPPPAELYPVAAQGRVRG